MSAPRLTGTLTRYWAELWCPACPARGPVRVLALREDGTDALLHCPQCHHGWLLGAAGWQERSTPEGTEAE